MPTFEFFGFEPQEVQSKINLIKLQVGELPFAKDIVFVRREERSTVVAWDGRESPFVRIYTRSGERADAMRMRLTTAFDIETVLIGFYPRSSGEKP